MIAWGLFKKIVISDRLARFVDNVYTDPDQAAGLPSVLALIFFAFQLYTDFSAYSDIAIGLARTLGFDLRQNFNHPYLAVSFTDFWKRWHISLSTWFRDYLYIPLGGNHNGKWDRYKNLCIVFIISGLWHGASFNFIIWGFLNALFLILLDPALKALSKRFNNKLLSILLVSGLWALSLVFFRSPDFSTALKILSNLSFNPTDKLYEFGLGATELRFTLYLISALMLFEYIQEKRIKFFLDLHSKPSYIRWSIYLGLSLAIIFLGSYGTGMNDTQFIYFQF